MSGIDAIHDSIGRYVESLESVGIFLNEPNGDVSGDGDRVVIGALLARADGTLEIFPRWHLKPRHLLRLLETAEEVWATMLPATAADPWVYLPSQDAYVTGAYADR
jgi:hypothetical protein